MLRIHSKVNTPYGEGILVSMVTEYNGLYIKYERTKCVVWFGTDGRWIVREFSLKELVAMNQDNIRNEKIDDILCQNM